MVKHTNTIYEDDGITIECNEITEYDYNNDLISKETYSFYNSKNIAIYIHTEYKNEFGYPSFSTSFNYDELGNEISHIYASYTLDGNNNIIKTFETSYDLNDVVTSKIIYEYTYYDPYSRLKTLKEKKYDSTGNII